MRSKDLRRDATYAVLVSGKIAPVRIIAGYADNGTAAGAGPWTCKNIKTGRTIKVRGAARFRYELEATSAEELERTGLEYRRKEPENAKPAGPLECARCGLGLDPDRSIRSNHTGNAFCYPGEGCNVSTAPTVRVVTIEERLAEADRDLATHDTIGYVIPAEAIIAAAEPDERAVTELEELDPLELDEAGQTSIGVAGEQRAIPTLAPPDPLQRRADESHYADVAEEFNLYGQFGRLPCGCPLDSGCDSFHSIA